MEKPDEQERGDKGRRPKDPAKAEVHQSDRRRAIHPRRPGRNSGGMLQAHRPHSDKYQRLV